MGEHPYPRVRTRLRFARIRDYLAEMVASLHSAHDESPSPAAQQKILDNINHYTKVIEMEGIALLYEAISKTVKEVIESEIRIP